MHYIAVIVQGGAFFEETSAILRIAIFALGVVAFAASAEPITLKGLVVMRRTSNVDTMGIYIHLEDGRRGWLGSPASEAKAGREGPVMICTRKTGRCFFSYAK